MTRIHSIQRWPEHTVGTHKTSPWRRSLARGLQRGSLALAQLATALHRGPARRRLPPELEFYAEAGAPEGALYIDGELIGRLPGVTRL
jgi:hypothetical protein